MAGIDLGLIHEVEFVKAWFRREVPVTEIVSDDPLVWTEKALELNAGRAAIYFCS